MQIPLQLLLEKIVHHLLLLHLTGPKLQMLSAVDFGDGQAQHFFLLLCRSYRASAAKFDAH